MKTPNTNIKSIQFKNKLKEILLESIKNIYHGSVTFVVQDKHIIQINKSRKSELV